MFQINTTSQAGMPINVTLDTTPDQCPVCHKHQIPMSIDYHYIDKDKWVQGLFRCTNSHCGQAFIATYTPAAGPRPTFTLASLAPHRPKPPDIPTEVAQISGTYVEIMKQVATAEAFQLDQLVGVGLRKALEFLIKDFAISKQPDKVEDIKKAFLGNVIKQYIDDSNVRKRAELATWLGNDETHYIRKWETKDIKDLKILVSLTVNAIHNILLADQYEAEMQSPKK